MRSFQDFHMRKSRKATGSETHSEKMTSKTSETLSDRSSPDPNCSICLSKMKDKSFTDRCFHMFCFECLVEWSKINAVCPLCKQPFKQIFHNIRSMSDYDVYDVMSHSSVLPSISSHGSNNASNASQPLLTNRQEVNLFLSQTSNEVAFTEWLNSHVREFIQVDAMQAAYVSNLVIDLLRVWGISSEHFYESLTPFFARNALDFIHSLDRHLYNFTNQHSREHTLEMELQRMPSRTNNSSTSRRSPVLTVPALTVHQRTSRNSTTSRLLLDGIVHSNTNPTDPGSSRFSVLLSIVRPSMIIRNRSIHASSSSSSSSPREEELIDIEQLDENRSQACKSPICVSSGDESQVQPVECSSRTKPHHFKKRRQQTFLLVSSDDESSAAAAESRKRLKLIDSRSGPRAGSNSPPVRSNGAEVKVTFKKHPTGHKNSLKCKNVISNRNEKHNEEEKSTSAEAEGESTGNSIIPGSSSSQNVANLEGPGSTSPHEDTPAKAEVECITTELNGPSAPSEFLPEDRKTCVILDDTLDTECHDDGDDQARDDLIDVDTISVYSDDSIEWIEDVPMEFPPLLRRSFNNETDMEDLEIMETKASDITIVSSSGSSQGRRRGRRKELLFVDLSSDAADEGTAPADQKEPIDLERSELEPSSSFVPKQHPRSDPEGSSTSLEAELGVQPCPSSGNPEDTTCHPIDLSIEGRIFYSGRHLQEGHDSADLHSDKQSS